MAVGGAVISKGTYVAISDFGSGHVADLSTLGINFSLVFTSNGTTFDGINIQTNAMGIPCLYYGSTLAFSTSWQNEAFKTIEIAEYQKTNINFFDWFNSSFELQAEEPSITDLTGTTWNVPSGWTATAGYGQFSIDGAVNDFTFDEFCIGYEILYIGTIDYLSAADKISVNLGSAPVADFSPTQQLTLSFTGGRDATNTDLISWLAEHGTLTAPEQPDTTDTVTITIIYGNRTITLTAGQKCTFKGGKVMQSDIVATVSASEETADELQGTWVLGDDVAGVLSEITPNTFSVNFTSNGNSYTSIITQYGGEFGLPQMYYDSTLAYGGNTDTSWQNEAYKTINITSELSEVENGDTLLTWLKAYATKQGEPTLISFTIGATTYYSPEGWSWEQWVADTKYNTSGYLISNGFIYSNVNSIVRYDNSAVLASSIIVAGRAYTLMAGGGAD